jgi:Acetyltransferase (GNAT) domain
MDTALLEPGDDRWDEVLERVPHDMYHLPGFARFATRWHENGDARAFVASEPGSDFLLPLIVRPVPSGIGDAAGWLDATGPRGYPGPVARTGPDGPDAAFLERAIKALLAELRQRQVVSAFVRCHPLLSPPLDVLRGYGEVVDHGESVSIDLGRSEADTLASFRENHRRAIRRARRDGYMSRFDESWARLPEFMAIYALAMDRLDAAGRWRLPGTYLTDLRAALEGRLHLWVVERQGALAAAAVISEVAGLVEYHLAATAPDHGAASPTKLLIEDVSRWARDRGDRVFHLAGSLRHDDALIHFKRGFSSLRHPVASWRIVADPTAYRRFVGRAVLAGDVSTTSSSTDPDFFPAYRRPA